MRGSLCPATDFCREARANIDSPNGSKRLGLFDTCPRVERTRRTTGTEGRCWTNLEGGSRGPGRRPRGRSCAMGIVVYAVVPSASARMTSEACAYSQKLSRHRIDKSHGDDATVARMPAGVIRPVPCCEPPDEVTAFGMSMGYGDPDAQVNQTGTPRDRVPDFARLLGLPA
jgi:hypothetical protein